jgi:phosphoglycolate phosphatase-like HAD superfamily hydrolase
MKYKNIIFDFDGVLAESVHIKTQAFYKMYEPFGVTVAEKVVQHHKTNGGMSRFEKFPFYHKTFLNLDLNNNDIESLTTMFSNIVVQDVIDSAEVPGALWFLEKYFNKKKWIVSATPKDEIFKIIEKRNMSIFFNKIYGSPEGKISIVEKIINENCLIRDETIFLGDALSDYNAATENDIDFALRKTPENKKLFSKNPNLIRFIDFYELDKQINN